MNWYRIATASILPIVVAAPIVGLCFNRRAIMMGTVLGSGVFFLGFVFFAAWEFAETLNYADSPIASSTFNRIVLYGSVAMVQAMVLFLVADLVEKRIRSHDRDPAWR